MAGTTTTSKHTVYAGSAQRDVVVEFNKLVDDVETLRAAADDSVVAVTELIADHATFKTVVDDLKTLVNNLRSAFLYNALGNPTFGIDTNFDVKNTEPITYTNAGTLKTLADNTSFNTGTSQVIATGSKWSSALLSVSSSGTATVTWSATLNAADEATAIAALPALPSNHTPLGYITVQSDAAATWTAGTDALTTGTGGTPAQATNYYNAINPAVATIITAAVSSSSPATLTASAPSATAIDTAGDMTAAKIGDASGTALTS